MSLQAVYKILSIIFTCFCVFLFLRFYSYHQHVIQHPYPLEYREGQLLVSTRLMLQGQNPFDLAQQPGNTNTYGLVYHWFTLPFAKMWGATFQVHRAVTAFSMFGCLLLLAWHWRREELPWAMIAGGMVTLYACLLYPMTTTALAGGNALGLMFMLASVLVPFHDRYRPRSLVFSVFLALLAFYTKSYFFLAAIFLSAYMFLFVGKKKGLLYGCGLSAVLLLSVLVINRFFETYFSTTFFLNLNISGNNVPYLFKQLRTWAYFHFDLLGVLGVTLAAAGAQAYKSKGAALPRLNVTDLSAPLLNAAMDLNLFCLLGYTALICAKLGRHEGSWMAYLMQLMSPWLILYVFKKISRLQWAVMLWMVLMAVVFYRVDYKFIWSKDMAQQWGIARDLVKTHQNVLNSPVLVSFLLEQGKPVYDGGYTQWSASGVERPGVWKFLKPDVKLYQRDQQFYRQLIQGLRESKFDLLMLTPGLTTMDFIDIQNKYKPVGVLKTFMPHFNEGLDLVVFVPAEQ